MPDKRATAEVQRELLVALEQVGVAVALFDPDERLRFANEAFRQAFAVPDGELPDWESMMRRCHRTRQGLLIHTDDIDAWIARVRRTHRKVRHRRFESDMSDGRWMSVDETMLESGWVLVVSADITALKSNESSLRDAHQLALHRSLTDPLTGLHNRRFIFERLDELLSDARQLRYPLAVAMLDLDHFKRLNDQHGHSVGDRVLVHFAQTIRPQLRPLDLVGRVGGEEFLILFPNSSLEGAQQALLRLHQTIAESTPVRELPQLRYTFSSGLAPAVPGDTSDLLFTRADEALYEAKAAGRGLSVMTAQPPPAAAGKR